MVPHGIMAIPEPKAVLCVLMSSDQGWVVRGRREAGEGGWGREEGLASRTDGSHLPQPTGKSARAWVGGVAHRGGR